MELAELAGQLYDAFETRQRGDQTRSRSDETFVTMKDSAPEWVRDLVYTDQQNP